MIEKKKEDRISKNLEFDYDSLDSEQKSIIEQRTQEIKERLKRSAQDIWEIGQKIFEVRSQLAYGKFDSWLKTEFGWSRRTAYNFIQVYEAFPERATVAQVSIAASALYQLASPSTPPEVRQELIEQAKQGQKITRQEIRKASEREKLSLSDKIESDLLSVKEQIVAVIPQSNKAEEPLAETKPDYEFNSILDRPISSTIQSEGWYSLGDKHFLFYGDTATPQFYEIIPSGTLAIAITSNDWDHDWLIDKCDNLIVLKETFFKQESISTLISLLSEPGDLVVFPWLPQHNIIELADRLGRVVVAGDSILERCQQASAQSQLIAKPITEFKQLQF